MLLMCVWPGFALIAVCSCVIYREHTNDNDAPTVVVLFCRQSPLGNTDMGLQQNRDKMPKFASNYTFQINNTLNVCVKYIFVYYVLL